MVSGADAAMPCGAVAKTVRAQIPLAIGIEKNEIQDKRISSLETKTEEHDIRISAIEHRAI